MQREEMARMQRVGMARFASFFSPRNCCLSTDAVLGTCVLGEGWERGVPMVKGWEFVQWGNRHRKGNSFLICKACAEG